MPGPALASPAKMSLDELVRFSELIVAGEVVAGKAAVTGKYNLATLRITEVFVGAKELSELRLVVSDRGPVRSGSIRYQVGQQGIWFLRMQSGSAGRYYLADNLQRLQPETIKEDLRRCLAERKKTKKRSGRLF
jgi:hypothetical protein